ncbi:protein of unknown function [Xenorhabdus bovienii]|uniref:Uncharacterized protein n=1 Tax=Xenorhabdus bovienii TaxID=40576 RepID=A0A0B6XAA4_XENBV|nr:protein of unknown function [Xenorhabdus bovienii]
MKALPGRFAYGPNGVNLLFFNVVFCAQGGAFIFVRDKPRSLEGCL